MYSDHLAMKTVAHISRGKFENRSAKMCGYICHSFFFRRQALFQRLLLLLLYARITDC